MAEKVTIETVMEKLGCTQEEAEDVLKWDKAIDKGEKTPFDLPEEKETEAKKMIKADRKKKTPTAYKFEKRERKANPTKGAIIAELAEFLKEKSENACENVEITNAERQISFKIGENSYELTLVQKRKPKN